MIYKRWEITAEVCEYSRWRVDDEGRAVEVIENTDWSGDVEQYYIEKDEEFSAVETTSLSVVKELIDELERATAQVA